MAVVRPAMVYGARDMCSDESAKEEVGCGGNEDGEVDGWCHKAGQKGNERITGTTKVGEISKCRKVTEKTVLVGKRVMVIDVPRRRK